MRRRQGRGPFACVVQAQDCARSLNLPGPNFLVLSAQRAKLSHKIFAWFRFVFRFRFAVSQALASDSESLRTPLRVFKDLFVEMRLPYAAVRGEGVVWPATTLV